VVIYTNKSYSRSITSIAGVLAEWLLGAIECIKERSANIVVILKAWLSIKGLKVVKNVFKVSCS
jgi:hypothetical protein